MALEIFTSALNISSPPNLPVMSSGSSDSIAIAALVVSIVTACATAIALSFSIWHTSRTRRSEELKVTRELMRRIWDDKKALDDYFDRYLASPLEDGDVINRMWEWVNGINDLINDIEEFRAHVVTGEIKNSLDISIYKIRLFGVLQRIETLRNIIKLEPKPNRDLSDQWIDELKKWCREGNEGRLPADSSVERGDGSSHKDGDNRQTK